MSIYQVSCLPSCKDGHTQVHHHILRAGSAGSTRETHPGDMQHCEHCNALAFPNVDNANLEHLAEQLLSSLETWSDAPEDHRANTPVRFVKMLREMTTRDQEFNFTVFPAEGADEMITLGPIPFYTLCAHHVVPFYGNCWVGYVPDEKIAGLSKLPRAVKYLAKGFWTQEFLTKEIADYLEAKLSPKGVAVVMKAEHMCMAMRGVQQPGVVTTTSAMLGVFGDHTKTAKAEFMQGVNNH